MILSDSPDQHYHVLTGSFASRSSPGGLGVVNFPDNHFTRHTIDEDHVVLSLDGEIPVHFCVSASSSLIPSTMALGMEPTTRKTLLEFRALADRHQHRQGLKEGKYLVAGGASRLPPKVNVVIAKKQDWLEVQQSKLRLVGWRITLTVVFFFLRQTIRFLD